MIDKKKLIGFFIAFIMVFSIFGFIIDFSINRSVKVDYGDFSFKQVGDKWQTKYNGKKIELYYNPQELENIEIYNEIKNILSNTKHIYLTYDVNDVYADIIGPLIYYLQNIITQVTDIKVERGLIDPKEYDLPKIDCTNATITSTVILIKNINETTIKSNNNCIIFGSPYEFDYFRYGERLLYIMLKIMN